MYFHVTTAFIVKRTLGHVGAKIEMPYFWDVAGGKTKPQSSPLLSSQEDLDGCPRTGALSAVICYEPCTL